MDNDLRPVLLLDFDDVICINNPYGGFDAKLALAQLEGSLADTTPSPGDLWAKLFDDKSKALLARIDAEFHPWYVLSTSWWWHFTLDEFANVLDRTGLDFVRTNLHETWATPKGKRPQSRLHEVNAWINDNPKFAHRWVALDDDLSGRDLRGWKPESERAFIVLCRQDVGFTIAEYVKVRAALARRIGLTT